MPAGLEAWLRRLTRSAVGEPLDNQQGISCEMLEA